MKKAALLFLAAAFILSGCAVKIYSRSPHDKEKIGSLTSEVGSLGSKVDELSRLREEEANQLKDTMRELESRLKDEIRNKEIQLEMAQRGLVITFLTEILFDSGKADIKQSGRDALDKVARVFSEKDITQDIGVEGHTDNDPIKHSGWKSNWELSTGRATSVLHYLVDQKGMDPEKLSATGYGEYRPVASNSTSEGKQKNRRVEIIIKPKYSADKGTTNITHSRKKVQEK